MSTPEVAFHTLPHADGSATYSHRGYTILGAVNGPLEPQRRDELPEEAFLEVLVRPATGTGGTRERHLERLLHSTLRAVLLTRAHPRSLIQLTLQILATPDSSRAGAAPLPPQYASVVPVLPPLLHTALLTLLAANIPLETTFTAALVAVVGGEEGELEREGEVEVIVEPGEGVLRGASSVHAFAFAGSGEVLVVESEGVFEVEGLERAAAAAEMACRGGGFGVEDGDGEGDDAAGRGGLEAWLRGVVAADVSAAARWRGNL